MEAPVDARYRLPVAVTLAEFQFRLGSWKASTRMCRGFLARATLRDTFLPIFLRQDAQLRHDLSGPRC